MGHWTRFINLGLKAGIWRKSELLKMTVTRLAHSVLGKWYLKSLSDKKFSLFDKYEKAFDDTTLDMIVAKAKELKDK